MKTKSTSDCTRRQFIQASAAAVALYTQAGTSRFVRGQTPRLQSKEKLPPRPAGLKVLMPRDRVPLSFVIDDSTCLVNMGHFCTPQFASAWPDREVYKKPWQSWPREIPDDFVREFGNWCGEHGVKGKYSIVPNPACVGWLDRELPGWSRPQLQSSLKLVRDLMLSNWDIHPEMITHTRVIDLKTGRPIEEINAGTMENSYPQVRKSVDEMTAYLAYALKILKNCDLPCEGITTPGGFGNLVKSELSLAVDEAVRDVYPDVNLPHYFKYVVGSSYDTEPKIEHLRGLGTDDLRLTMNVPAGTGDWFGGWQGDTKSDADKYCTADASSGRMVELIKNRRPAVMLCHWPGIYSNGTKDGFHAFQRIVKSIRGRFGDHTQWMKMSDMGRYWAVKDIATIESDGSSISVHSPFATQQFTIQLARSRGYQINNPPAVTSASDRQLLRRVSEYSGLDHGTFHVNNEAITLCVNLPKGRTTIQL